MRGKIGSPWFGSHTWRRACELFQENKISFFFFSKWQKIFERRAKVKEGRDFKGISVVIWAFSYDVREPHRGRKYFFLVSWTCETVIVQKILVVNSFSGKRLWVTLRPYKKRSPSIFFHRSKKASNNLLSLSLSLPRTFSFFTWEMMVVKKLSPFKK